MLKNYFVIAVRHFFKHKLYSAINVLGLALGMASCILMIMFVRDEVSYDKHFANGSDLYRIQMTFDRPNGTRTEIATSAIEVLDELKEEMPGQILRTEYLFSWPNLHFVVGESSKRTTMNFVGPDFLSTFDFPMQAGDPVRALQAPNTAVISASLAEAMFPGGVAMGRRFSINAETQAVITGILAPDQENTHFAADVFVSRSSLKSEHPCGNENTWRNPCAFTYVQVAPGTRQADLDAALATIVEKYAPDIERLGKSWKGADWYDLSSIRVSDIHLMSKRYGEMKPGGDISLVYVFSFLSVLILIIACINFTNLATARASDRSKEVSIRKIVGAGRGQIFAQILSESLLLSTLALIIALAVVELALPTYNATVGKELTLSYVHDFGLVAVLLVSSVLIGFIGGAYPALFLSSFRPITLSKGLFASVDRHLLLRSSLVVVQFAISIGLMSATFVVNSQMEFARKQALQFERGSVLAIDLPRTKNFETRAAQFKSIVNEVEGVSYVGASSFVPPKEMIPGIVQRRTGLHNVDHDKDFDGPGALKMLGTGSADPAFFDAYGIQLVAGRMFAESGKRNQLDQFRPPTDEEPETWSNGLINRQAAAYLGFESPEDAVGQVIDFGLRSRELVTHMTIIGVVADVNFLGARSKVEPALFFMLPEANGSLSVRINSASPQQTVRWIKKAYRLIYPDEPLQMHFVDESYDALFAQETIRGRLFAGFSILAMFIACLGLYGLASVSAERRTQEIGLRKVMGASVGDIVQLLLWQFSQPVLIANLIAWPIAFWSMQVWLSGFAVHIPLRPWAFLAATALTVAVALVTVGWQARKVAMAKPAETLRYE